MEKRKLAKIPSGEASDEMVRFSDRATVCCAERQKIKTRWLP